jgi:hypothetical protein
MALTDGARSSVVNQHSGQFFPPFARLNVPPPGTRKPLTYGPLDLAFSRPEDAPFAILSPGELSVWRLGCLVTAIGVMNDKGEPPTVASAGSGFTPTQLFDGVGEVVITNRRVIFLAFRGQSPAGAANIARGNTFAMVFPLDSVEAVVLSRRKGLFGTRDSQVRIEDLSRVGVLVITGADLEYNDDRWQRAKISLASIMDALVKAAATARLAAPDMGPAERRLCEDALRGKRLDDGDELIAQLVP